MISSKAISGAAAAAGYHFEKNSQQANASHDKGAEYYAKGEVRSAWGGEGAALWIGENGSAVGQGAQVEKEDFIRVLEGRVRDLMGPREAEDRQLGRMRNGKNEHRAGIDFTFSPSKSVSIESEVFGSEAARRGHEIGVQAAMDFLEREAAQTRVDGRFVKTRNLIYAKFEHSISRELDPQTHTHVVIANMTMHEGRWMSLSNERLLELRTTADQIYKATMAHELQKAGYRLDFAHDGNFELQGYTPEQVNEFSLRTQQIDAWLAAHGIEPDQATGADRTRAFYATRAAKAAPDSAELQREQWLERGQAVGLRAAERHEKGRMELEMTTPRQEAERAVAMAREHLSEREMAFSRKDLYANAARFSEGRASYADLEAAIRREFKAGELSDRADGKATSRGAVEAEKFLARHLEAGRGAHVAVMTDTEFDKSLAAWERKKGFALSDEQRDVARMILTGDDRFQGVQGLAGTGKTTLLQFVREAAESRGWLVRGHSNGAKQAEKMQIESGIKSATTAQHLIGEEIKQKDATLARAALRTLDSRSSFSLRPDFEKLEKDKSVTKAQDSSGRRYYITRGGETYTPALYQQSRFVEVRNLRHAGLTKKTYTVGRDGHVYRQGGTLKSEAAAAARRGINQGVDAVFGRGLASLPWRALIKHEAKRALVKHENWGRVGLLRGSLVKAQLGIGDTLARSAEYRALQAQAQSRDADKPMRILNVLDEASMSATTDFNKVIKSAERAGEKTIFLGDRLQHQSISAGTAFEQAQAHMPTVELGRDSIRRQQTEEAKSIVGRILDGDHAAAVQATPAFEIRSAQEAVLVQHPEKGREQSDALRLAAREDNKAVIKKLAKDYVALPPAERDKVVVITSTNADRRGINEAIREGLKERGELQAGVRVEILERTDKTAVESKRAASYRPGEIVQFGASYKQLGVEKNQYARVEKTSAEHNTLTLRLESGDSVTAQAGKVTLQSFRQAEREFAPGDSIRFTKNESLTRAEREAGKVDEDRKLNGMSGTVLKIQDGVMHARLDSGREVAVNLREYRHIDHAYATTSVSAQGQTKNQVWVHHNTEAGRHGDRETYVNLTRMREVAKLYTQDISKAAKQAGMRLNKTTATASRDEVRAYKDVQKVKQMNAGRGSGRESAARPDLAAGRQAAAPAAASQAKMAQPAAAKSRDSGRGR